MVTIAVLLILSGRLAWTREEALASIVSVETVDLPVSPILAKMEDEFGVSGKSDCLLPWVPRLRDASICFYFVKPFMHLHVHVFDNFRQYHRIIYKTIYYTVSANEG